MSEVTSPIERATRPLELSDGFDLLSKQRTRTILGALRDRPEGRSIEDLATTLASEEHGVSPQEVTAAQRRNVLASLHHHHLPELESLGVVYADEEGHYSLRGSSAFAEQTPLGTALDLAADETTKDRTFSALAVDERRTIVGVLRNQGVLSVAALAAVLAANHDHREATATVALHHKHLPKLSAAGIVEYDPDQGHVTYDGVPVSDQWLDRVLTS